MVCRLCGCTFAKKQIIDGKKRDLKSRKYCLSCSPFMKHNRTKLENLIDGGTKKKCPVCGEIKLKQEFYRRRVNDTSPYCKECTKIRFSSKYHKKDSHSE